MSDTGVQQDSTPTMFANLLDVAVGTVVAAILGAVDSSSTGNQQTQKPNTQPRRRS